MASAAVSPCSRPRLLDWRLGSASAPGPVQTDLQIYQGDTYAGMAEISNADGTPADLTGYTAASQIRRGPADLAPEVVATLTGVFVPPNQISLSLSAAQTAALPIQESLYWDLELTAPDGVVTTVLSGGVIVTPEVTRPEVVVP